MNPENEHDFEHDLDSILREFSSGEDDAPVIEEIPAEKAPAENYALDDVIRESDSRKRRGPLTEDGIPVKKFSEDDVLEEEPEEIVSESAAPVISLDPMDYDDVSFTVPGAAGESASPVTREKEPADADETEDALQETEDEYEYDYDEADREDDPPIKRRPLKSYDDYDESEYAERRPRRKWILPLCIFLFIVLLVAGGATYFAYRIDQSDRIFPNVFVGGIDIGGMTRQEAADMLESCDWDRSISGELEVRLPLNVSTSIDYTVAGLRTTSTGALNAAEAYGRDGNMFEVAYNYINAMIMPVDVTDRVYEVNEEYVDELLDQAIAQFDEKCAASAYGVDRQTERFVVLKGAGEIKIDREALRTKVLKALANNEDAVIYQIGDVKLTMPDFEKVREEVYSEAVNAYYDRENDTVVDEVIGVDFDVDSAAKVWSAADPLTYVYVPIKATYAEITGSELRAVLFRDVLGEFTTSFKGSEPNRCSNINLAVNSINGVILLPEETFSYNQTVGERTAERGYLEAGVYEDGEVTRGLGGGICQVSSTLCVAVRKANLAYTRANHQFIVNYMEPGLDATVDWPNRDFTFTNTREYPVRIHAVCDNDEKTVTIQIIGTDVDGSYVEIENPYYSAYTWGQANPGDTNHSQEYLNTWVGDIYKSIAKRYDKDGNLLEIIYNSQYDYCMYLRHDVVMPEDTGPEVPPEEETVSEG